MKKSFLNLLFIEILFLHSAFAQETCSRVAFINYQEVLVDASSSKKGEGLRYFLNKDPIAKSYLDEYQESSALKWQTATIGTLGTLMLITGIFKVTSSELRGADRFKKERFWLIGGASLITFNLILSKTLEISSEDLLQKSVEEYNKRNLPRIYLSPFASDEGQGITSGIRKEF